MTEDKESTSSSAVGVQDEHQVNDDPEDPAKSPPHSPSSSTRKVNPLSLSLSLTVYTCPSIHTHLYRSTYNICMYTALREFLTQECSLTLPVLLRFLYFLSSNFRFTRQVILS